MAQSKEEFFKRLEALGVAMVRTNLATNVYLAPHERVWVLEFLERSSEASTAEQLALARSVAADAREAKAIAQSARRIAITSVIVAIVVAIFGTVVAVIVPHYWR